MRKPKVKRGVLTREKYQSMSEAVRKPYEDLAAEHGYEMKHLYEMEVRRKTVLFCVINVDAEGRNLVGHKIKECPR